ncbi:MAG: CoA ester lyase [Actinomycetota bacterium]|nr:CoA ester lyase [Actinomycetota bacterium]
MTVSLVVPGSSEKMLGKAATLAADEIVLDLEDAVAVGAKERARELVRSALPGLDRLVAVRINEVGSPWVLDDVLALVRSDKPPNSLVIPKVESRDDVAFLDKLLGGLGSRIRLQLLIETAKGIRHLDTILSGSDRVDAVILGYADLAASLGSAAYAPDGSWAPYQAAVVSAARAAGVQPVDGPYLTLDDAAGLAASIAEARAQGFSGKWAIHPSQVEPAVAGFMPTEQEVATARAVLVQLEESYDGALRLDGQMIDEAVAKAARALLSRVGT